MHRNERHKSIPTSIARKVVPATNHSRRLTVLTPFASTAHTPNGAIPNLHTHNLARSCTSLALSSRPTLRHMKATMLMSGIAKLSGAVKGGVANADCTVCNSRRPAR